MYYFFLVIAIVAEIVATTFLKISEGFTKIVPSCVSVVSYIICYYAFSKSLLKLNLGVAYAIWCGAGIAVTTMISILVFKEKLTLIGAIGIILIAVGCVLLNFFGNKT